MKMAKIFLAGCNFSFLANALIKPFVGEYFRSFFLALLFHFPLFSMRSIVSQLIVFLPHEIVAVYLEYRKKEILSRTSS